MVNAMLDLVKTESERIDSRVLEPACGSGNFLIEVYARKLAVVDAKYGSSDFERRHHALFALMCIYGIELLDDNVTECRQNLLAIFDSYLDVDDTDPIHAAAAHVLDKNIVHGDALSILTSDGEPLAFAEWGYLGKGKYQRRDFRFDALTQMSSFDVDTLFGGLEKHEIFTPLKSYPPLTVADLAS